MTLLRWFANTVLDPAASSTVNSIHPPWLGRLGLTNEVVAAPKQRMPSSNDLNATISESSYAVPSYVVCSWLEERADIHGKTWIIYMWKTRSLLTMLTPVPSIVNPQDIRN